MRKFFFLLFLLAIGYFGYTVGGGFTRTKVETLLSEVHPDREFQLAENKTFSVVIYAHNDALFCEKALRSVFEQEYENYRVLFIDDASFDGTYEKARAFILENHQDHRVILTRNETKLGQTASLYRTVDHLLDREIVLPLDAKDWLAHPTVLSTLNRAYQNPDVWMTLASEIIYPSYTLSLPPKVVKKEIEKTGYTSLLSSNPTSFYSALFRKIRLPDLMEAGRFSSSKNAYLLPLLEMSGGRIRSIGEPILFKNHSLARNEIQKTRASTYSPLGAFPKPYEGKERADLLIFSFDRPMQLYACLESIERYVSGCAKVSVLYRTSGPRMAAGYHEVQKRFPKISFIQQAEEAPKKNFKPHVMKTVFDSPSEYILFAVDDIIVTDFVDLKLCMEMMDRTSAYGFYLRFGKNIRFCYQNGKAQSLPDSFPLAQNIFAWDITQGEHDWGFPNTVDMTLFRKKDLFPAFEAMRFNTPNSLEFRWATDHAPKKALGLYFDHSKIVNLPLNVVSQTGNPHTHFATAEDLLGRFERGEKIDIDPLYRIDNPSPHFDLAPEFILR